MQVTSPSAIRSAQPVLALLLLLILWQAMADLSGSSLFPSPRAVLEAALSEARSGLFLQHLGITLLRVAASLVLALAIGGAIGLAGLQRPIVLMLALAAVGILILGYVWLGPIEAAVIAAIAVAGTPGIALVLREGARAVDRDYAEMAAVYGLGWRRTLRHVVLPQLAPHLLAAVRNGLSLIWKIVLVIELLGRSDGVGFQLQSYFQLFDVARVMAYGLAFVACVLVIERQLVVPLERRVSVWRQ